MKTKKKRTPKDFIDEMVEVGSANIGIGADDFRAVVEKGKSKTYAPGTCQRSSGAGDWRRKGCLIVRTGE